MGDRPGAPASPPLLEPERPVHHPGLARTFRALRHPNFRYYIAGHSVSVIGTWMQSMAQAWLVYRLSHSEFLLGLTWFCAQIPVFALGPFGGTAADRYPRLRIVFWCQIVAMVQAGVLAALTFTGRVTVPQVLVLASVSGAVNAFDIPARNSLLIHMAGPRDLLNAIALHSMVFNSARMLGPALAGVLVATAGEAWCFLLNAVSFLAVLAALRAIRLPGIDHVVPETPFRHLIDGFRFVRDQAAVRSLLLLMAASTVASAPVIVLLPFFADALFHRGAQGVGLMLGGMGLGAVIGVMALAGRLDVSGLARVAFTSSTVLTGLFAAFALSPYFLLSLALMLLIGFSAMRMMTSANTIIQTIIPDEYRGRIMAFYSMTVVGLSPVGSILAGVIAEQLGPRATVLAGAGVFGLASLWFATRLRLVNAALAPPA